MNWSFTADTCVQSAETWSFFVRAVAGCQANSICAHCHMQHRINGIFFCGTLPYASTWIPDGVACIFVCSGDVTLNAAIPKAIH